MVPSKIIKNSIQYVLEIVWEEHCVECAMPDCYKTCELFVERKDKKCSRFLYGIRPNDEYQGRYSFGADIVFRKWGKLEAYLNYGFQSPLIGHKILNYFIGSPGRLKKYFKKLLKVKYREPPNSLDEFLVECYSPNLAPFKLILEYFTELKGLRTTKLRRSFNINFGHNTFSIPFENFNTDKLEGYLCLYPEDSDPEKRIIFTWLDFVKYKQREVPIGEQNKGLIKCVAWDLDNTIWNGIVSEDHDVVLNKDAVAVIHELDRRGILQTVVSKNDFEFAFNKIEQFNLQEYFLYPAINWNQKSENLKGISHKLNVALDSFAVVDDSAFEREEILSVHPQVRVYSEKQILDLLNLKEFTVPNTDFNKSRRKSYFLEAEREKSKTLFSGSYDDFLRSCHMEMDAFVPNTDSDKTRCWELVQRSNQLNLSTNRYSKEAFDNLLRQDSTFSIGFRCKDKFGDYGIVGFSSIHFVEGIPTLEDMVISCRIAQKRVEHTLLRELCFLLLNKGYGMFRIKLVKTKKNYPLQQVFNDLPFNVMQNDDYGSLLQIDLNNHNLPENDIIKFEWIDMQNQRFSI